MQHPRILLFPGITGEDGWFRDTLSRVVSGGAGETMRYPGVSAASDVLMSLPLAADLAMSRIALRGSAERFVLIGYSYGGNLAFEVAHRMTVRGLAVDLLVLVDPALAGTAFSLLGNTPARDDVRSRQRGCPRAYALRPIRVILCVLAVAMPGRMRRKLKRRVLYELRVHARRAWSPVPIGTRTVHILSEQLAPAVAEGWRALCPSSRQVFVAGSHVDILRPPGRAEVADAILAALDSVPGASDHRSVAAETGWAPPPAA